MQHQKLFLCLLLCFASTSLFAEATIILNNVDDPNEGYNDLTPATPIGGNTGTTLGEQRQLVMQYAFATWGARLNSAPTIVVRSSFQSLGCDENSGTLAAAGSLLVHADFPGVPNPDFIYPVALANAITGTDINAQIEGLIPGEPDQLTSPTDNPSEINDEIVVTVNADIGDPDCLSGSSFYMGLDNQPTPGTIDLLNILMHELAHGLGFQDFFNPTTGQLSFGRFDIYSSFLFDNVSGLTIPEQPDSAARVEAINNPGELVWLGENVNASAASQLDAEQALVVNTPASISGDYAFGTASFGPLAGPENFSGTVILANDDAGVSPNDACEPLINTDEISGNIALIDRDDCNFDDKVQFAQDAGATAVIIANTQGRGLVQMGGDSTTVTIPSISISNADGDTLRSELENGVTVSIVTSSSILRGADSQGRVKLFSPDPPEGGSSVSHFDFSAFPNLLMEPAASPGILSAVNVDLTDELFSDLGWDVVANPVLPIDPASIIIDGAGNDGSGDGGNDGGNDGGGNDGGGNDGGGTTTTPPPTAIPTSGGGGGGSPSILILFLISGLLIRRNSTKFTVHLKA